MDEYDLVAREEAERLGAQAEATSGIVRVDLQRAANYVLAVVLFAIALFFVGAAGWIATFPVSVSVSSRQISPRPRPAATASAREATSSLR
jgi:hypothetical protein